MRPVRLNPPRPQPVPVPRSRLCPQRSVWTEYAVARASDRRWHTDECGFTFALPPPLYFSKREGAFLRATSGDILQLLQKIIIIIIIKCLLMTWPFSLRLPNQPPTTVSNEEARPRSPSSLWEAEGEASPTVSQPPCSRRRRMEETLGTGLFSNVFHQKKNQKTKNSHRMRP